MQSRTRYDRNKKPKIQKQNGFQVEKEDKTADKLNVEKLYNFEDPDLEMFYDLSEFLSQEIMLMKSENVEKAKGCEIINENNNTELNTTGKEKFDNFTIKIAPQFIKESTSESQGSSNERRSEYITKFPNSIVSEIYADFDDMEDEEYNNLENINPTISEICYRKKIKKTYSNKKRKMAFGLFKDSFPTTITNDILQDKIDDSETSKIDVILSQPVSENLVKLSSYFMSPDKLDIISQDENLERTASSIDLQKLFNRGNAMFFGRLIDPDPLFYFNTKTGKSNDAGTSKNKNSVIKYQDDFCAEISKNLEKTNIQLLKMKQILSPQYHVKPDNTKFKIPKSKTPPKKSHFSDYNELWPDEDLLQNIAIMETETNTNSPDISSNISKVNTILTCNNFKTQKRRSNIEYSNFSLKVENRPLLKRKSLDLKPNYPEKSDFEIEESMPEFLTASQKKIHISHEALSRAKSLIKCDTESTDELDKISIEIKRK